ncbi:Hypothetical predicted protein [Paramuricea clavata]|uniref:Uncharacterized protein n=1 Tax=Paramuricea clavata TaxID=317549 RepID=A0A7D9J2M7_PARCT|nr:Hypothetical predicted protein [Paramuricea clavata]
MAEKSAVRSKLVCYLDFENQAETEKSIKDKSPSGNNNGYRESGLLLVNFKGCGNAAYMHAGDILFHGDTFQDKPYSGITVAAWVRLLELPGSHSIFDTIGSSHECGQYHFEINDGNIRWFHRNETQQTVFSVEATGGLVKQGAWVHIAGTYDGTIGKAKIYVNGDLKNMSVNEYGGYLSRDWNMRVGIGDHKNFRPVLGFVDEFRIYNYAISKKEITDIVSKCKFIATVSPANPAAVAAPPTAPAVPPVVGKPPIAVTHDAVLINDDKERDNSAGKSSNQEMEETILKRSKIFRKHRHHKKNWD